MEAELHRVLEALAPAYADQEELSFLRGCLKEMTRVSTEARHLVRRRQELTRRRSVAMREQQHQARESGRPQSARTRIERTETMRLVPDAPGHPCQPDPFAAKTTTEFVKGLQGLRRWAGNPALRELARRSQGRVAHSTLSVMLNRTDRLPEYFTLLLFLEALGLDEATVSTWITARRELEAAADRAENSGTAPKV